MKIHPVQNTNFESRNKTIRFADDIARKVNQCFPRVSPSKMFYCINSLLFFSYLDNMACKTISGLRFVKGEMYDNAESFYDKIKAFIKPIKQYKIGNCGESAQLAAITAKINGIKNCHIAYLYNSEGEDLDHAIVFVNDKKPYIIDSWLGIADYVPNIINKYKSEYNQIFNIAPEEDIYCCSMIDDEYTDFLKNDFSRKQINKLRKMYPNLFIKRGYV